MKHPTSYPQRIVCLTEETTETLYLLGEGHRVVGVSAYTVRPPEARAKPAVSAFVKARIDKIRALEPDLVLTFSDLQADIARELLEVGLTVFGFNQRSVAEILDMVLTVARLVGAEARGAALIERFEQGIDRVKASAARFARRPRVFFEEWNDPLISGIRWVDELIEIAGGESLFTELREKKLARDRVVTPATVASCDPEIVIGSWCGKRMEKDLVRARPGWAETSAARAGHIYEIASELILQPGPAALTDGLRHLHAIVALAAGVPVPDELRPGEPIDPDLRAKLEPL